MVAVRFHAGPVTDAVVGLAAAARGSLPSWADELPDHVRDAIAAVGDTTGEVWFHLLSLAVELDEAAAPAEFVRRVETLDASELMRRVLGANVPAWRDCVAVDDLEAAADGDRGAGLRLVASDRYYGGRAARALPTLLEAGPEEAQRRIVAALELWFDEVVAPRLDRLEELHARLDRAQPDDEDPLDTVERVTGGFRFEPEDYTDEVVLVPEFAGRDGQVLAQHEGARIVAYDASGELRDELEVLAEVFAALGDTNRLEMLRSLARHPGGVSDLARQTGLAKSTTHRHVGLLRDAGVVALAGQAWRYRYEVRPDRIRDAAARLLQLLGDPAATS